MKYHFTQLPGVIVLEPQVFSDDRGFFLETYREKSCKNIGLPVHYVQDNHSRSCRGVIRGLHYQLQRPQGKLVRVSRGSILDIIVDVRVGSPTFAQSLQIELSEENHRSVYVPPGYAHGICVLSEIADLHYKCTDYYQPEDEFGIAWNDAELAIEWPVTTPILSTKDQAYPSLRKQEKSKLPRYCAAEHPHEEETVE